MISVEQLIGDLLLRHNCVIVPTFGGFVANQTSAVIDYVSGTMMPPKKSLMFNRQLINNDGLLVSEFARNNNASYTEAHDHVVGVAATWMDTLRKGERVVLDRIGHLYFDQERNIRFEQDRFFNLLLQSYGLGKVHFVAEEQVEEQIVVSSTEQKEAPIRAIDFGKVNNIEQENEDQKIIAHPAIRKRSKAWRYVAAACLLPVAFYTYWIPVKTDVLESGMLSIRDFNPFYHSTEGTYVPNEIKLAEFPAEEQSLEEAVNSLPSEVDVYSFQFDEDTYIPVKVRDQESLNSSDESPSVDSDQTFRPGMHFIVGCFASETNATNLVTKLRAAGLDASIQGAANGLTRVSAGGAMSEESLAQIASKAKSLGYTGWVLKQ